MTERGASANGIGDAWQNLIPRIASELRALSESVNTVEDGLAALLDNGGLRSGDGRTQLQTLDQIRQSLIALTDLLDVLGREPVPSTSTLRRHLAAIPLEALRHRLANSNPRKEGAAGTDRKNGPIEMF